MAPSADDLSSLPRDDPARRRNAGPDAEDQRSTMSREIWPGRSSRPSQSRASPRPSSCAAVKTIATPHAHRSLSATAAAAAATTTITTAPTPTPTATTTVSSSSTSHLLLSPSSPSPEQRKALKNMWELASVHNFLIVFRPILNINLEFSMDELDSALLKPNTLLDTLHISLLKGIPPINRANMNQETWVTYLCKKMKEWWHWVAEGQCPLVLHHGEENAMYRKLSPDDRVVILKALCELRLDQDDVRLFIDEELKKGTPVSSIRKENYADDMQGLLYWYENDPVAGQRLYREIRVPSKRNNKASKNSRILSPPTFQWETLATNLEEFESVVEKLCSSRNKVEVSIGKKIDSDIIPELNKLQQKKERALKRQQRQALLIDSHINIEGLAFGRSRRERKPVTYTFDDFDKSISDAIKRSKNQRGSPALMAEDNFVSNSSNKQKIELEGTDSGSDPMDHNDDRKNNYKYVESDEAAFCSEDERVGHIDNDKKRKRLLQPGLERDGIGGNHSDYDGNDSGYESSMGHIGEEEEKDNAFGISIGKLKAEDVLKCSTQDSINGHAVHQEREHSSVKDNAEDIEGIKYTKIRSVDEIKDEPLSDLNLAAVGSGLQNGCSRRQKDSACFVMKVEEIGV